MNFKIRLSSFLWLTGICGFVILGVLDLWGDGVLQWAHYIWLGVGLAMVIVTGAIAIFTNTCSQCGMMILFHDNFCRRCGKNILLAQENMFPLDKLTVKNKLEKLTVKHK